MTLSLSLAALAVAQSSIGEGEHNPEWMERIWEETGPWPGKGSGEWCAVFASWCFRSALVGPLPFAVHRGAKRLTLNVGEAGRFLERPEPGALICWDRGVIPWQKHVGIIEAYDREGLPGNPAHVLSTIEGNKRDRVRRVLYRPGEWQRRLYRMAIY